jgi:hypothetical protein
LQTKTEKRRRLDHAPLVLRCRRLPTRLTLKKNTCRSNAVACWKRKSETSGSDLELLRSPLHGITRQRRLSSHSRRAAALWAQSAQVLKAPFQQTSLLVRAAELKRERPVEDDAARLAREELEILKSITVRCELLV